MFQRREQTITSSGGSLSQAKLTTAHGAFVDLSGKRVNVNKNRLRVTGREKAR